ncbi:MAG: hypothetical protein AAF570_08575 [Bacteroidota bacterium]
MKNAIFPAMLLLWIGVSVPCGVSAQQQPLWKAKKGSLYAYWGYNRAWFTRSNLHFNGPNYDFTLYDLAATDRPSKFGGVYFNPTTITIPQYNYRLGYHIDDRWSVSLGIDHMKYVVTDLQETRLSGIITEAASPKYEGAYLNEAITLEGDLLKFEHTDGFNLVTLDAEYLFPIAALAKGKIGLFWNAGVGGIWVVTKTNVKVFGDGLDNDFHVAGFSLAAKTGPRIELGRRFFVASELKSGYASLNSVLVKNEAPEIGDHNLTFLNSFSHTLNS